jgi:hypothetical protein
MSQNINGTDYLEYLGIDVVVKVKVKFNLEQARNAQRGSTV